MALGSKNRDYRTSERRVQVALKYHREKMNVYIENGIEKGEASTKAFYDYKNLTPREQKKLLREWKEKHW